MDSKYSLYYRLLKSLNGILAENLNVNVPYLYLGEKLQSEISLAKVDENYQLPLMSAFTGSLAHEISEEISVDDEIIVSYTDDACEYNGDLGSMGGFKCVDQYSPEFNTEFLLTDYVGISDNSFSNIFINSCICLKLF